MTAFFDLVQELFPGKMDASPPVKVPKIAEKAADIEMGPVDGGNDDLAGTLFERIKQLAKARYWSA